MIPVTGYAQPRDEWLAEIARGTMLYFDNPNTGVKEQTVSMKVARHKFTLSQQ